MGFPFVYICDLLQLLEDNAPSRAKSDASIIRQWFVCHQNDLNRNDVDLCAVASTLLPARRPDRVYGIQARSLCNIVARALCLGRSRIEQLKQYERPGSGRDLAESVEAILVETPNALDPQRPVCVEEIDAILHAIAAKSRFSSPAVRHSSRGSPKARDVHAPLQSLYLRLDHMPAKWLTRLILKDFSPVDLDPALVSRLLDSLLPVLLKIYDDLPTAIDRLRRAREASRVATPALTAAELARQFKPMLGVKVGRQPWLKGRSIKHCLQMGHGRMSVEKKMDGEYCQVHIDLSRGANCIQIFSKSGKDSTQDRVNLHPAISSSLALGKESCRLRKGCILEGELVVYSERDGKILPFEKIRKHVSRSGSFFHRSALDSQAHPWEKLMMVYYDVLMVDDESLLGVCHSERFRRLSELVITTPGVAELVKREIIDFGWHLGAFNLRQAFARCITAREEGLVLKPDDPYFDFGGVRRPYSCSAIKLKKEYIGGFGDVGDLAVVGARYDPAAVKAYHLPELKWTHFYVGCLDNKKDVLRCNEKPRFMVTNVVELNSSQMEHFRLYVNPESLQPEENSATILHFEPGIDGGKRPSVIFPNPPIFDIRCFSFVREGNVAYHTPRFPMVTKMHCDRTWRDVIEFEELQRLAREENEAAAPDDSQELIDWIAKLEAADPGGVAVDAISQQTGCSRQTTSQESPFSARIGAVLPAPVTPTLPPSPHHQGDATSNETNARSTAKSPNAAPMVDLTLSPCQNRRKRPSQDGDGLLMAVASPPGPKLRRRSRSKDKSGGAVSPTTMPPPPSPSASRRGPLEDMTAASSDRTNSQPVGRNPDGKGPLVQQAEPSQQPRLPESPSRVPAYQTAGGIDTVTSAGEHSSAKHASNGGTRYSPPLDDEGLPPAGSAGVCKHHGKDCTLGEYVFLLAPCIAQTPWVTEDLLQGHGVYSFETDINRWNQLYLSRSAAPAEPCYGNPSTRRSSAAASFEERAQRRRANQPRLMVLVEPRREEATASFLARLKALRQEDEPAGADGGRREYAGVFDWRILEDVAEQEVRTTSAERRGQRVGPRVDRKHYHHLWRRRHLGRV
ncbi:hypothetical protein RB595_008748 [Gaeumannomyces hyphopodioides]